MSVHPNPILRCLKSLFISACFLLLLIGSVILLLGIAVYVAVEDIPHFLSPCYLSPITVVIIAGIVTIAIAFFGCYGARYQNVCSILMFAASLATIILLEFLGVYAYPDEVKDLCDNFVKDIVDRYKIDDSIYQDLKSYLEPTAHILIGGTIIIEVIGLISTCVVCADARKHSVRRKKRDMQLKEELDKGYKPVEKVDETTSTTGPEKT